MGGVSIKGSNIRIKDYETGEHVCRQQVQMVHMMENFDGNVFHSQY